MEKLPVSFNKETLGKVGGEAHFKKAYYRKKFYTQKLLAGKEPAMIPIFEISPGQESDNEDDYSEDPQDQFAEQLDNSDEKVTVLPNDSDSDQPFEGEPLQTEDPEDPEDPEDDFDPERDVPDYAEIKSVLAEFKERGFTCKMVSDIDPDSGALLLFVQIA